MEPGKLIYSYPIVLNAERSALLVYYFLSALLNDCRSAFTILFFTRLLVLQPVQEIDIYGMCVPVHHYNDRQSYAHFRRCHYHDEEYEQLPVCTRAYILRICRYLYSVVHF